MLVLGRVAAPVCVAGVTDCFRQEGLIPWPGAHDLLRRAGPARPPDTFTNAAFLLPPLPQYPATYGYPPYFYPHPAFMYPPHAAGLPPLPKAGAARQGGAEHAAAAAAAAGHAAPELPPAGSAAGLDLTVRGTNRPFAAARGGSLAAAVEAAGQEQVNILNLPLPEAADVAQVRRLGWVGCRLGAGWGWQRCCRCLLQVGRAESPTIQAIWRMPVMFAQLPPGAICGSVHHPSCLPPPSSPHRRLPAAAAA